MGKFILFSLLQLFAVSLLAQDVKVAQLTCESRTNPIGIDAHSPKFSWKIISTKHNISQSAYQIVVADHPEALKNNKTPIWDSKKITTSKSIQIDYAGAKLQSGKTYYWKVKIWDNHKKASNWSEPAMFQMGILYSADWKGAEWIAFQKLADSNINILPTDGKKDKYQDNNILPMFRKEFNVSKSIKKATIFISGLGHFELSANGKKVGDHFLDPGWSKYDKEALYVTFDITKMLQSGKNALGVMLGNGFYYVPPVKGRYRKLKVSFGYPKMICRLLLEYQDGTTSNLVSNSSWRTAPSPVIFSSIYGGEDYDANLEQKNWNKAGFNDEKWKMPILVKGPKLIAQNAEAVKVMQVFEAKSTTAQGGEWIYDFGQNASSTIELKIKGKKGDTVRLMPAELLKDDGTATQKNIGGPSYFTYILKGDGIETWQPKFFYTGFRYLQVKGAVPSGKDNHNRQPVIEDLNALHVRNAAEKTGTFQCSNELFNKTFSLIDWAIKSNMVSVFTDCPHREKLGWLEELHLMGSSVRYNYNVAPLFVKALADMQNSQLGNGLIPEIAPEYVKFEWGGDMFRDSPEWGSSGILMPWYLYQWYGDTQALTNYYPMMQRYINYLKGKADQHILSQGLGDWYDLGPKPPGVSQLTPMGITATAIYYYDLKIMQKIALTIGKPADAAAFAKLAVDVRRAFNAKFFNPETKQYGSGSQAANAMAVYMGLVEETNRAAVIDNLVKDIKDRSNSLTAGDIGYRYVLRVLEDAGKSDVIFDMNSRSDVPGYGMQIAKGATALTESWAALPTVSNNHFMLGHLMEWFYSGLAGIKQDESAEAFKKIIIQPELVGNVTSVQSSYNSPYGIISTQWKKNQNDFEIELNIPANTSATLVLPYLKGQKVSETQQNTFSQMGVENGKTKISIGSGHYKFICTNE
ncbi:family 78 glycoside hydrolase catalytic domain [Pedobacter sp. AW1-32]|uniref:family 78 glycoside hydrolase catalytic domain n=1 Tax=Pedobacter sp. AW1-32 TaxID=3383026 RepID=UPI003FEE6A3E